MPRDCTATRQLPADEQSTIVVQPVITNMKKANNKRLQKRNAKASFPGDAGVGRMGQAYEQATGTPLDKLVGSGRLTRDGCDWLVQAIDPFHDYKRMMSGYPDMSPSATVVTCYKYTAQVAPGGGAGLWDCHIFSLPRTEAGGVLSSATFGGSGIDFTQAPIAAIPQLGFLNILSMDSAAAGPLFPTSAAWAPAGMVTNTLPAPGNVDLSKGYSRVVAAGFEVHNTTSDMYKNGRVTVYSMPQHQGTSHHKVTDGTAGNLVTGSATYKKFRSPPSSSADAMKLAGSMQWDAKDGVYMPIAIAGVDNPIVNKNNSGQYYTAQSDNPTWALADRSLGAAAAVDCRFSPQKSANVNTVGVIFEGLSPQTTLTVTLKVYVEMAPTVDDSALAPLASPSAAYDLHAFQLYSRLLQEMPIGTKIGNNANGDWFRWILKRVYAIAQPIIGAAFPELAPVVNPATYMLADSLAGAAGKKWKWIP